MISTTILNKIAQITGVSDAQLTFSNTLDHGDYTSNVALRIKGQNPQKTAQELVQKLEADPELKKIVSKIEVAGPGFINFFLTEETLTQELDLIRNQQKAYGRSDVNSGKKVIVEYSSPNIAKPFTVGHLRSTIIGDAVSNIMSATGWTVYRDNHLGDWGTQFGKQVYAIKTWGDEDAIEKSPTPVKELVSLYVKFHEEAEKDPELENAGREWFKKLEDGDPEVRRLWQKCIDWSWKEFNRIYEVLGVHFTENKGRGFGESFFEDKMEGVLTELEEKGLLKVGEEGAKLVFFPNDKYPPLMIVKKDGATLYATRDLATDKYRLKEYGKDTLIINEVGGEQSLQFKQLFEVERMLGWVQEGQRVHLKHGLFRFADKKMSTRKGNVVWLQDVLAEAFEKAKVLGSQDPQTINTIAVGALKWNELKRDPVSDIVFDWDEILNMKGNSGPYMQYTVVRIKSLLSKTGNTPTSGPTQLDEAEQEVVRVLRRFSEVVLNCSAQYKVSELSEYLFKLAQKYNTLYDSQKIIGGTRESSRILVSQAVAIVLENGLSLLGIHVPEKM